MENAPEVSLAEGKQDVSGDRFGCCRLRFADLGLEAEYRTSHRMRILGRLFTLEVILYPINIILLVITFINKTPSGYATRINNAISLAGFALSRRWLSCRPSSWRHYDLVACIWVLHHIFYQSMTANRWGAIIGCMDVGDPVGTPYAMEGYVLLWSFAAVMGFAFYAEASQAWTAFTCAAAPIVWLLQVTLIGTPLPMYTTAKFAFVYCFLCFLCFAGGRSLDLAHRGQFMQEQELSKELVRMRSWHGGLCRILAVNFDASGVLGLDLVLGQSSTLWPVLGRPEAGIVAALPSVGSTMQETQRLQDFFGRLQQQVLEDPDLFYGPDKITATLDVVDSTADLEIEAIWIPRCCPDSGSTVPEQGGALWVGLRRAQVTPGELLEAIAEGPPQRNRTVELPEPAGRPQARATLPDSDRASHPESLAETTPSGHIFTDLIRCGHAEGAKMQEQLVHVAELGQREDWLIRTQDLQLLPERILGRGSYGCVAVALLQGVEVAVKVPKANSDSNVRSLRSMANELCILRKLRHPNVVMFRGACIDPVSREICLVSELVHGTPLEAIICRPPMFPDTQGRHQLLLDISSALCYLHSRGPPVIHGDLKPANVMVERWAAKLRAKIIDFGLARLRTRHSPPLGGSLLWKAPEVIVSRAVPLPSADVFSFGLVAYFVVTGLKPLPDVPTGGVKKLRAAGKTMPDDWPEGVPFLEECRALCLECLRPQATERPSMAHEQPRLLSWLPPAGTVGTSPRARRRSRGWAEDVRRLQRNAALTNERGRAALADDAAAADPQPTALQPCWRLTPEATKRVMLLGTLEKWNVVYGQSDCCTWHARVREGADALQRLQRNPCRSVDTADSQCQECGILEPHWEDSGHCAFCTFLRHSRREERPGAAGQQQTAADVRVMSL